MQRELPLRLLADISYVGNTQRNVSRNVAINSLPPSQLNTNNPANIDPTEPRSGLRTTSVVRTWATTTSTSASTSRMVLTYNSIQVSVSRRLSNGFAGSVAYTGSTQKGLRNWDYFRTEAENRARHTTMAGAGRTTW